MPRGLATTVQGLSGAQEDKPGGMEEQGRGGGVGPEAVPGAGREGGFLRTEPRYASKVFQETAPAPLKSAWKGKVLGFPLSLSFASPSVPFLSARGGIPRNTDAFCRVRLPSMQSWCLCPPALAARLL